MTREESVTSPDDVMGPFKGHVTSSYRTGLLEDVSMSQDGVQFVGPQTSNHFSCRAGPRNLRAGPVRPVRFGRPVPSSRVDVGFCCRLMALERIRPVKNSLFKLRRFWTFFTKNFRNRQFNPEICFLSQPFFSVLEFAI